MTPLAMAEGLLSRFELTQGKLDECPITQAYAESFESERREKKATLQYKIINLKDGTTAQGYSNIR